MLSLGAAAWLPLDAGDHEHEFSSLALAARGAGGGRAHADVGHLVELRPEVRAPGHPLPAPEALEGLGGQDVFPILPVVVKLAL